LAFKKKLHRCRPGAEETLQAQRSRGQKHAEPCDPQSLERGVRQLLADKVSTSVLGLWLLVPEHLRLGTWDLLVGWSRTAAECFQPRLALQLVHEAALCTTGIRAKRALTQRGFALSNGLPFIASDAAIHQLLGDHTVADAERLQGALGQLRQVSQHYAGKTLIIDPHRMRSYSQRDMRRRHKDRHSKAEKMAQVFFAIDADTAQPLCFTTGSPSRTVTQATPGLLDLAAAILGPQSERTLVLADAEHFTAELIDQMHQRTGFDLLVPMAIHPAFRRKLRFLDPDQFTPRWAGIATTKLPYRLGRSQAGPFTLFVQRSGERRSDWKYLAFLGTHDRDEVEALTLDYPKRWHIEEFFNRDQALGWDRAGTQNLNIRYGQMTMALVAQAVLHQLRQRLREPEKTWDAKHLAKALLQGLEGDVRVTEDTIIVTYYNAPNAAHLREHYEGLPQKLIAEKVDPKIPWLYNYMLDFRFR
jgi:Transposase DDE domain